MRRGLLILGFALAACSGGSTTPDAGGVIDAGSVDAGPIDAGYDATCSNPSSPGNSLGVGKFCSPHGHQCNVGNAVFCTVDTDTETNEWFCTTPCLCDTYCGEGAICTGGYPDGGGENGCVPLTCSGGLTVGVACFPDGGA